MKRITICRMLFLAAMSLSACSGVLPTGQEGSLSVVVSDGLASKASDVTELPFEKAVNQIQLFLFEGSALRSYEMIDTRSQTFPFTKTYPGIRAGEYQVFVVANAADLSFVETPSDLLGTAVRLSECSLDVSRGFVMAGSASVTVGGAAVQAPVALQRFASRIRLVSVENHVPASYAGNGSVAVKGVFLANALGRWTLSGSGAASEWVNLGGRTAGREAATERSDFLVAEGQVHPAACRGQVFRELDETLSRGTRKMFSACCLYTFPNTVATDHTGNTATEAYGAMTRLVVLAEVDGQDWWYPVTLFKDGKGPQRNMSYDVKLTLRATGSSDPNEPVGAGSLEAGISVKGWLTGVKYTETL